ncbi:hypothetical protein X274_05320 [Marinitoga sp. 1155]|nr:hypothetical protein X274_05320 [Marinitoga sp. 1155]NUU99129.1 hypothetical protein [Marinitoga sp. 1154]
MPLVFKGELMKKNLLILWIFLSTIIFSNNIYISYMNNGDIKIDYNFDFEATNLYVANISFFVNLTPLSTNSINVSSLEEILNYLRFYQPGFSINYKYKNNFFYDPYYFTWSNDSFIISFEKAYFDFPVSYVVSNGMAGITLKKESNKYFYWINIYDFSQTAMGYYYGDKIKIGFFVDTLNKEYDYGTFLSIFNSIITISKKKVYFVILDKNINIYFEFKSNKNIVRSNIFRKRENYFEFNIPIIRDNIYVIINSNKTIGIKFNLKF